MDAASQISTDQTANVDEEKSDVFATTAQVALDILRREVYPSLSLAYGARNDASRAIELLDQALWGIALAVERVREELLKP